MNSPDKRHRPNARVSHPVAMRHARRPSRRPLGFIVRFATVGLAVVLVSTVSVAAIAVWETTGRLQPGIHLTAPTGSAAPVPGIGAAEGEVNILLTGTDTRTGQGGEFTSKDQLAGSSGVGNNDVTMVLHISADHDNASVISIPRDLVGPVPACPDPTNGDHPAREAAQFNTTLSEGGLNCVVLTAEKLTGLTIPFAAIISFDGVIALSNAVGGVTVCLASDVDDSDTGLHLQAGERTIQGDTALQFVRTRYGVGDGSDLGRISNQQVFLSALMRKITSAGVLGNPVTLYSLANAAVANITPSDTLTNPASLVSIALAIKDISLSRFVFVQYPTDPDPDDRARVIADKPAAQALVAALAAGQPLQLAGGLGVAAVAQSDPTPDAGAPSATASAADPTDAPSDAPTDPTAAPSSPTPGSTAVTLPDNVSGQTAEEQTCTKGNN
ncbi:LCP family protein [Subtercola sp. Z020]|uniref:LCP family protein n=1 Tax=Subtercola sp. Z020 TaxID=2080582 RepID=UPI001E3F8577|nr:LCP family protein [Subtercola sp. Z020]